MSYNRSAANGAVDGPADRFAEGTGDAAIGMKQSASLGSLIDVGASLSNRREALTVRTNTQVAQGCTGNT